MEQLLTPAQTSKILNVPVKTLERWRGERTNLPYVHVGRGVRYRESDIIAWVERNTIQPGEITPNRG